MQQANQDTNRELNTNKELGKSSYISKQNQTTGTDYREITKNTRKDFMSLFPCRNKTLRWVTWKSQCRRFRRQAWRLSIDIIANTDWKSKSHTEKRPDSSGRSSHLARRPRAIKTAAYSAAFLNSALFSLASRSLPGLNLTRTSSIEALVTSFSVSAPLDLRVARK